MTSVKSDASGRMPVLFIPHGGGPCFFMDWNPPHTWDGMGSFLKNVAADLPRRPKAIVMVSAHWREGGFNVTGHPRPELIYDYYGFPPHTYELTYPAPGAPALAELVVGRLQAAGLEAGVDPQRGYDHGMFIPLKLIYPNADIPVIQLSLRRDLDPAAHLAAGKALAALRDEDVLIIGSGMSFHNMRAYGNPAYTAASAEFDKWLTAAVESPAEERNKQLENWAAAPYAHDCHPPGGEEHLIPLMVAAGAAEDSAGKKVYSETVMETVISAFRFG